MTGNLARFDASAPDVCAAAASGETAIAIDPAMVELKKSRREMGMIILFTDLGKIESNEELYHALAIGPTAP